MTPTFTRRDGLDAAGQWYVGYLPNTPTTRYMGLRFKATATGYHLAFTATVNLADEGEREALDTMLNHCEALHVLLKAQSTLLPADPPYVTEHYRNMRDGKGWVQVT